MLKTATSFLVFLFLMFLSFFLLFAASPIFATNNILFTDDFENNNFDNWQVIKGVWEIKEMMGNHMIGTDIETQDTVAEIIAGQKSWDNYIYEVDMVALEGADKNIIFRIEDNDNKYGIHMRSKDGGVSSLICIERWSSKGGNVPSFWDECDESWDFVNNKLYHLKIIALNNNIKFYVDDVLAIDFTDEVAPVDKGKVGLRVGTGTVAHTEVYFDNIKVTKIQDPVILVPGHGASISFKGMFLGQENADDWRMVPGAHVYDNLINALKANGYEEGRNLAIFYYNWLMPIDNSAKKLCQLAGQMASQSPTGKVNLVGHSMGGLVARTCAQKYDNQHFVKNLVTVGSPHQGVPESYGAWEGGEIWKEGFINKFAFELFLNIKKTSTGNKTRKETVREIAPSTKELMPVFDYLKNVDGQVIPFSATNYPQNEFLLNFPSWDNFSGQAKFVYGQGKDTLRWLTVDKDLSWKDEALKNWQYGKPINLGYENDGDGTVSIISAYPAEASFPFTSFELAHREIVSKDIAVNQILKYLDIEATTNAEPVPDAVDYLAFYLLSPAYLKINFGNIPESDIFMGGKKAGEPRLIIIANPPIDWRKEVVVKGTGNGEYVFGVGLARGKETSWREYHGEIKSGEEDKFLIEATDKISLKSKESSGKKRQDEEMLNQLKTGFSSSSLLTEKLEHLTALMKISPVEALKYAYRIKNLVALEAKEKGTSLNDLNQMNKKLDQLIVYLEAAAENEEEIYPEGKAALAYQETKSFLEELEQLSPSFDNPFVISAAQSLTLAEESLPSSLPRDLGELIRLGRGYFLGINSKILLN